MKMIIIGVIQSVITFGRVVWNFIEWKSGFSVCEFWAFSEAGRLIDSLI